MSRLQLTRPLTFFDLEATGLQIATDRIVELSYITLYPDGREQTYCQRFNPGRPMSAEASAITGITDDDLKNCPAFKEHAPALAAHMAQGDLAGFNSSTFDVPLLVEEFIRAGVDFPIDRIRLVDAMVIYHKMEKRDLTAAYKYYCHGDLIDAHSAMADTRATLEVLKAQVERYADSLPNHVEGLADFSRRNRNVDLAGRIIMDEQGREVFNFGKYKGKPVADVLQRDPGFFSWMMQGDFTQNTKQVLMRLKLRMLK